MYSSTVTEENLLNFTVLQKQKHCQSSRDVYCGKYYSHGDLFLRQVHLTGLRIIIKQF